MLILTNWSHYSRFIHLPRLLPLFRDLLLDYSRFLGSLVRRSLSAAFTQRYEMVQRESLMIPP